MRVLVCEPFYGGSHRQFVDGWRQHSAHDLHLLTLPARWWKWRMRHAAIDFAEQARALTGPPFDLVLSTSMVNVAELRGLLPASLAGLPHVLYMHENQLTYPSSEPGRSDSRDLHLAMNQVTSALACDALWFNSEFHRRDFLEAVPRFLASMPERLSFDPVKRIAELSQAQPPGVEDQRPSSRRGEPGPLHIGWVARWEHDKNPELFFAALSRLSRSRDFKVSVLGERFREAPDCFERYRREHPDTVAHWGYCESRDDYFAVLDRLDVVVSTARHEFFGLAVVEALMAGALPLLPERLSYPELLEGLEGGRAWGLYDGSESELVRRLEKLCDAKVGRALDRGVARPVVARYGWSERARALDEALEAELRRAGSGAELNS